MEQATANLRQGVRDTAHRFGLPALWRWWLSELAGSTPAGPRAAVQRRRMRPILAFTTEAAVVSMYDIVVWSSVRVGGIRTDESIMGYVRKKYNLIIGEQTAEEIKINIGSALPLPEDLSMEVRGRDQVAGLPKTIILTSSEITEAMSEPLGAIIGVIRQTLEKTPPELAADIIDRGMVLSGGGALLRNIDRLVTKETGVPAFIAEYPLACVALGAGRALENYVVMRRSLPVV